MPTKKQTAVGASATLIAILGAVGGIEVLNIDFSQDNDTTIIDDHSTTETNVITDITNNLLDRGALAVTCQMDEIPEEFIEACKNR